MPQGFSRDSGASGYKIDSALHGITFVDDGFIRII